MLIVPTCDSDASDDGMFYASPKIWVPGGFQTNPFDLSGKRFIKSENMTRCIMCNVPVGIKFLVIKIALMLPSKCNLIYISSAFQFCTFLMKRKNVEIKFAKRFLRDKMFSLLFSLHFLCKNRSQKCRRKPLVSPSIKVCELSRVFFISKSVGSGCSLRRKVNWVESNSMRR